MPAGRSRAPLVALVAVTAIASVWLSAAERPDTFFNGDNGLKLIASLSAIAHPSRPLEIDLPRIGDRPVPYVEHMVSVHDGHAHVLQSPMFPVLSAPLIHWFGLRGAYILPLVSFIALIPLLDVIRRHATPNISPALTLRQAQGHPEQRRGMSESDARAARVRRVEGAMFAWIAVVANPVVFYAFEYWEHAPAIACVAASVACALIARDRPSEARRWMLTSGALGGCAILLRPEAAWCLAGMLLIVDRRQWVAFGLTILVVVAPFGVVNFLHAGNVLGPHAAQSLAPLQSDWLTSRVSRIRAWLWPTTPMAAAGVLLVAGAWLPGITGLDVRIRQVLVLIGAALVSWAAGHRMLERDSLWQAFPIVSLALMPTAATTMLVRRLAAIAAIASIAIILTATHDGGAQWGPRFLLISSPIAIVLAARAATDAVAPGRARAIRIALVAVVVFEAMMTERSGYLELRGAKRQYGRIVSATSTLTHDGDVILTNVWWFDQVNASLYGRRVFLFVPTRAAATTALSELAAAHVANVKLVWTGEGDGESLEPALAGTCFHLAGIEPISERLLSVASVKCDD